MIQEIVATATVVRPDAHADGRSQADLDTIDPQRLVERRQNCGGYGLRFQSSRGVINEDRELVAVQSG